MKGLIVMLEIDSASGICIRNIVNEFLRNGHEIDLVSYPSMNKCLSAHYFISPKVIDKGDFSKSYIIRFILLWFRRLVIFLYGFIWPWNSSLFASRLYLLVKRLYVKNHYDIIIPVYTQIDPLAVCSNLKNKYKDFVLVPYFLDSLSGGPKPWFMSEMCKINKGLYWEKKYLFCADSIVYMESSRLHHERFSLNQPYYNKVSYLDIPMLTIVNQDEMVKYNHNNAFLTISYIGSIPIKIRDPYYAINILQELLGARLRLIFVGDNNEAKVKYQKACNQKTINWIGKLPHERIQNIINKSDILLNIGNRIPGMVPSKIFEYISYKKPIISISPIDNEPSIPYLKNYSNACLLSENDDYTENKKKLETFLHSYKNVTISNGELLKKYRKNTPFCFCEHCETFFSSTRHFN